MADLLASLVGPSSQRSSQESFRSLSSQPRTHSPSPSSKPLPTPPTSTTFQTSAFQAAGLPVYDVDSYLAQNASLRSRPTNNNTNPSKGSGPNPTSVQEPVPLGTKSSFHIAALNTQCQSKGFLPVFDIEGTADFGGVLKLRGVTVTSERRWNSKKEAREGLAEKGLGIVKEMEAKPKESGGSQEAGRNWIGLLNGEYYSLLSCNAWKKLCSFGA